MDGGGRLLRSLSGLGARFAPAAPLAFAGASHSYAFPALPQTTARPGRRRPHRLLRLGARIAHSRYLGTSLVIALLASTTLFGAVRGGQYDALVADYGRPADLLAKALGFSIRAVTISGAHELNEREVLSIAGVSTRNSLLFASVADMRARLKAVPLVKEASVTKLYPGRLLIDLEERQPTALWQKDGELSLVAADGTPIDEMRDARYEALPLVVGEGANANLADYLKLLDAAGELRGRIRAGIFVSGRRWTLRTDNGLDIDLPETKAADALARFAKLEHDTHILEKDVVALDLRIPGRVIAELSPDAAAARAEAQAKKSKKKGAAT